MKIASDIYLVGGGKIGLSDPCDCNIYLIDGHPELSLIDTGSGLASREVLENITQDGFDPRKIKNIIITHAHADHAGGALSLAEMTGAKILAPATDKYLLENGTDQDLGLDIARYVGIYPRDYVFKHCPVYQTLEDEDLIESGIYSFRILHTPGHSKGSTCYYMQKCESRCLFSGDVIAADGVFHFNSLDVDLSELRNSISRLKDLHIDSLFPGHGLFVLRRGYQHIEKGWNNLQSLTFEKIATGNPFLAPRLKTEARSEEKR